MSDPSAAKFDPVAALAVGGLAVVAVGIAAAALLSAPKFETPDEVYDRLVAETLRRGGARPRLNAVFPSSAFVVHDGSQVLDTFTSDDADAVRDAAEFPWTVLERS